MTLLGLDVIELETLHIEEINSITNLTYSLFDNGVQIDNWLFENN
jgi:hypothetical protein